MRSRKQTVLAVLSLGMLQPLGAVALAAENKETTTAAVPAAAPATDLVKLEAEVGLSPEQKGKVNILLSKMKAGRRAVKEDPNLSPEDKKKKIASLNQEIFANIKALMTPEQYAKWEKLQEAIRSARAK